LLNKSQLASNASIMIRLKSAAF